jgi:hypothetical protein
VVYALIMTIAALQPVRRAWDEIFGPNDAQLIIVSAVPIRNVSVTYDGRSIVSRPDWPTKDLQGYATFPAMRTRIFEPVLSVSWEGPDGARSVSRVMRQADSGRVCLYVLNLNFAGVPIGPEPPDELSPFWWTCYSR